MDEPNPNLDLFRACIPYFEVLADPTRQQLVLALGEQHRSLNVGALTEKVSLSRPAVSHHLKVLLQAGMVGSVKKGTESYYYLTLDRMIGDMKRFVSMMELTCLRRDS